MTQTTKISTADLRTWAESAFPHGVRWIGNEGLCHCCYHDDKHPSLAINTAKFAFNCQACGEGGDLRELAEKIGKPLPGEGPWDLPPERKAAKTVSDNDAWELPPEEIVYDYTTKSGKVLYQKVRRMKDGEKDFIQRRPGSNGRYIYDLKGITRILYRENELREALAKEEPVFVTEGEKDVDALVERGLIATTNVEGASLGKPKWLDRYTELFPAGAVVYLCGDYDTPGQRRVKYISEQLHEHGCRVRIVDLGYELGSGKDITDWLAEHPDPAEFMRLVDAAPEHGGVEPFPEIPLDDLLDAPPTEFLIGAWLALFTVTVLVGRSGEGKTWIAMTVMKALAIREEFLWEHYRVHKHGRVVYFDTENPRRTIGDRLRMLGVSREHRDAIRYVEYSPEVRLDTAVGVARIRANIKLRDPVLVIFDALCEFHGYEENSEEMKQVMSVLRAIRDDLEVTILVLHHRGKGKSTPGTAARGSSAITAGADCVIVIDQPEEDTPRWVLQSGKMRVAAPLPPQRLELHVDGEQARVTWEGPGLWAKNGATETTQLLGDIDVLQAVIDNPGQTGAGIGKITGHNREWARRHLEHLENMGKLHRVKDTGGHHWYPGEAENG